ncbi:unnamed protein product [Amoebophrya sp. A120]|nr:unnamed protein product [Amoebophrya sp. A120]|eukprot:GSA120T00005061001.1
MGSRYCFNIFDWEITEDDFAALATQHLPEEDSEKVLRFVFLEDRKRAFVSRLMQKRLALDAVQFDRWLDSKLTGADAAPATDAVIASVQEYYNNCSTARSATEEEAGKNDARTDEIENQLESIEIWRTSWGKPFLHAPQLRHTNFNFNISHEGAFVVGASDYFAILGIDVAAPKEARKVRGGKVADDATQMAAKTRDADVEELKNEVMQLKRDFGNCLSDGEWNEVERGTNLGDFATVAGSSSDIYGHFMRIWSLKECFIKARGDGLGFELLNCEFCWRKAVSASKTEEDTTIVLAARETTDEDTKLKPQPDWRFHQETLPSAQGEHVVSIGRGPIRAIQEDPEKDIGEKSIKSSFRVHPTFTPAQWEAVLRLPMPPIRPISLFELLQLCSNAPPGS